jgi:exodeoxyribonuclease V beta subunit
MNIWLMPGEAVGRDYQTFMAQLCAAQIRDWLSAVSRAALLWRGEKAEPGAGFGYHGAGAQPSGGVVDPRCPAALAIPSVYLSNRDSVFETLEAQELLWLLQAVLAPSGKIRCAARWRPRCSA